MSASSNETMRNQEKDVQQLSRDDIRLIHFTTADLSNIAKEADSYDLDKIQRQLNRVRGAVLITRFHLIEWVPYLRKWGNAERLIEHFSLFEKVPLVVYSPYGPGEIWTGQITNFREATLEFLTRQFVEDIEEVLAGEDVRIDNELLEERWQLLKFAEANFWTRYDYETPAELRAAVDKFYAKNSKHGVEEPGYISYVESLFPYFEVLSRFVSSLVPDEFAERSEKIAERLESFGEEIDVGLEAGRFGVESENPWFQIYRETRRQYEADPSLVGGLDEEIDLRELAYLSIVDLITVDGRTLNKLNQAFEKLEIDVSLIDELAEKCGHGPRILEALRELPPP